MDARVNQRSVCASQEKDSAFIHLLWNDGDGCSLSSQNLTHHRGQCILGPDHVAALPCNAEHGQQKGYLAKGSQRCLEVELAGGGLEVEAAGGGCSSVQRALLQEVHQPQLAGRLGQGGCLLHENGVLLAAGARIIRRGILSLLTTLAHNLGRPRLVI